MNVSRTPAPTSTLARVVPSPAEARLQWATVWPWLFWLCWGAWLAVSDLYASSLQLSIMRVLMGAAVLGFARPTQWWRWSLALAAWVPFESGLAAIGGLPAVRISPGMFVLPLFPALVGGFLGRSMAVGVLPQSVAKSTPQQSANTVPEDRKDHDLAA